MKRRIVRLLLVGALASVLAPAPAGATVIAAAPGSYVHGYAGVAFVAIAGQPLTFANLDVQFHNVQSDDVRTSQQANAPHCASFTSTTCPLFVTPEIGIGETAEVAGVDDLPTGVYPFHCAPHPWMTAMLVVVE